VTTPAIHHDLPDLIPEPRLKYPANIGVIEVALPARCSAGSDPASGLPPPNRGD